jgi:hypothetical protein
MVREIPFHLLHRIGAVGVDGKQLTVIGADEGVWLVEFRGNRLESRGSGFEFQEHGEEDSRKPVGCQWGICILLFR